METGMAKEQLTPKKAQAWYYNKVTNINNARLIRKNLTSNVLRNRDNATIGKMFFFWYMPKHYRTLPTYDRFPLVFPIEPYPDGFLGLNLHYLTERERRLLLGKLKSFATSKQYTERTRLRLTYDLLSSTKGLASLSRPCIKRYLFSQVRSPFVEITADEWEEAIMLPVELFITKGS